MVHKLISVALIAVLFTWMIDAVNKHELAVIADMSIEEAFTYLKATYEWSLSLTASLSIFVVGGLIGIYEGLAALLYKLINTNASDRSS